jgi:hypothetical protein
MLKFLQSRLGYVLSAIALVAAIGFMAWLITGAARAADLGGACCSDLEERIAELEATTARKGNRKVTLTVYGQINKAVLHWKADDVSDTLVTENSAAESFVGFKGEAKINGDVRAGYVLEIGVGGFDDSLLNGIGYGPLFGGETNGVYTRRSYLYVQSASLGQVSLGKASQATDDITSITTANTDAAVRMLSIRPFVGPELGEVLDIFDGTRADVVRYDSPAFQGFKVSASWGNADLTGNGDVWDVALRYAGEFQQIRIGAGVGYRQGVVVPLFGATQDVRVISGSASVMHMPTGIFATGAAGDLQGEGPLAFLPNIRGWQVQGGVEQKWSALGRTTVFGEFGQLKITGSTAEPQLYGFGLVQNIEAAALDVYLSFRRYELDAGSDAALDAYLVGGRIKY